ncbi:MAG TPA: fibronectin type III-like domain-contianing protein, partial [Vicinamibacterales bacterium]
TRLGDESVLLYTRQHYASVTPPGRRLRAFERISLEPGASKTVEFALAVADLGFVGRDLRQRVEPARFDVMVGDLTTGFEIAKP